MPPTKAARKPVTVIWTGVNPGWWYRFHTTEKALVKYAEIWARIGIHWEYDAMVGGTIIGLAIQGDEALVNLQGSEHSCEKNDRIAVRVKLVDHTLAIGDSLWWQGDKAYWTPQHSLKAQCGVDYDIPLQRVGYSHAHCHANPIDP